MDNNRHINQVTIDKDKKSLSTFSANSYEYNNFKRNKDGFLAYYAIYYNAPRQKYYGETIGVNVTLAALLRTYKPNNKHHQI